MCLRPHVGLWRGACSTQLVYGEDNLLFTLAMVTVSFNYSSDVFVMMTIVTKIALLIIKEKEEEA